MAIDVQKNEDSGNIPLFTGLMNMKVELINPTNAEKRAKKYSVKEDAPEPVYYNETSGARIDIHLLGEYRALTLDKSGNQTAKILPVRAKHAIWLKNKKVETVFINRQGRFSKNQADVGDSRHPYQGEIDLINFIKTWGNLAQGANCYLETLEKLVHEGDARELKQLLTKIPENPVRVLLGVRTVEDPEKGPRYFQHVYGKRIERTYSKGSLDFFNSLVDNQNYLNDVYYGPINLDMYNALDFTLQEWHAEMGYPSNAAQHVDTSAMNQTVQEQDDDLEFINQWDPKSSPVAQQELIKGAVESAQTLPKEPGAIQTFSSNDLDDLPF